MFPQRFDGVPPAVHIHALGEARTRCPRVSSKAFQGMGRYAIAASPLFVPVGARLDRWAWLREPVPLGLGLLLPLLAGLLGTGAYVS